MNKLCRASNLHLFWGANSRLRAQTFRHFSGINVVLLKDIEGWGKEGQEITVKRGYARNNLIPSKAAVYATKPNLSKYKSLDTTVEQEEDQPLSVTKVKKQAQRLSTKTLQMKRHSPDGKKLHAPVTAENVSAKLEKFFGLRVAPAAVALPGGAAALTAFGNHRVGVLLDPALGEEARAEINLELVRR
mmetsp:Transcript_9836/g.16381  ORF Transcript_9836/g.16381 Transcript_9836/m.16381 type:complete len:188 (+) Transcript_9836:77-640(+)